MLYQFDRPNLARAIRLVPLALWLAWLALFPPAPAQALALTAATEAELSAAISAVNAAGAGNHAVTLTADITLTGPLPALDNMAAEELLLDGAGHTLTGDDAHTILVVTPETDARVHNLTLTGGRGSSGPDAASGGAIYTQGYLRLESVTVTGNTAVNGGGIVLNGVPGDYYISELHIVDSVIADNHATADGGGLVVPGEGEYIYFATVLTITNTVISGNSAGANGGAVATIEGPHASIAVIMNISGGSLHHNTAGIDGGAFSLNGLTELELTNTSMHDNEAGRDGGAISSKPSAGMTLNNSALYRNRAGANGGAVANYGNATFSAMNSTISGNEAAVGGGLYSEVPVFGAPYRRGDTVYYEGIHLSYTTVAANSATTGGGIFVTAYLEYSDENEEFILPELVLTSSLISGNSRGDCRNAPGSLFAWRSAGFNLDSDGSCGLGQTTDRPEANAALLPLADNGGPTPTHALAETSAAVDIIPVGLGGCPQPDQRGVARPQHLRCDSGAYELESPPLECPLPLTAANPSQLIHAILCANRAGVGRHTITLTADITLTTTLPVLDNPEAVELLIEATGITLTGDGAHTVLAVASLTTVRLHGLTITNGLGSSGQDGHSAGGVYNRGRLIISDAAIVGNSASHGGGVYNRGELIVEASEISTNTAVNGGGGGVFNVSALTLDRATITGNSATAGGGIATLAQSMNATLTISDSSLTDNTAETGGGVYVYTDGIGQVAVNLSNTWFERNMATAGAGAIDLFANRGRGLTANVAESRFEDNSGGRGGALGARSQGGQLTISVSDTIFNGNDADEGGAVAIMAESAGAAEAQLSHTTLSNNLATGSGGGGAIYTDATSQGTADLTILNTTLSNNHAASAGGGLRLAGNGGSAGANVAFSTLAGNTAQAGGGGVHISTATGSPAAVTLTATIVTNQAGAGPDCARSSGSLISGGYNLAGDGTCYLDQASDLPASPAGLLPLGSYTPGQIRWLTHPLLISSPARDHIPSGEAGCGTTFTIDQRGAPRPQSAGGRCDIGAYERQVIDPAGWGMYLATIRR